MIGQAQVFCLHACAQYKEVKVKAQLQKKKKTEQKNSELEYRIQKASPFMLY